ncbi:MAG: hypothetical protein QW474_01095 [Candidatus Aenigmatarchaeota archaeon]
MILMDKERNKIISKLLEYFLYSIDSDDYFTDMLLNGFKGFKNMNDIELLNYYHDYFPKEYFKFIERRKL